MEEHPGQARLVEPPSWLYNDPAKTLFNSTPSNRASTPSVVLRYFPRDRRHACGWKSTEEETELRNHLKWARIKVMGDARSIPSEVSILKEGYIFKIPIWVERQITFERVPAIMPSRSHTDVVEMEEPRKTLGKAFTQRTERGSTMEEVNTQRFKPLLKLYPRSLL